MNFEPFNDDPDHVPVRKFQLGIIFAFLNFHRRSIVGFLLVAAVAYLLFRLNSSVPQTDKHQTPATTAVDPVHSSALNKSQENSTASIVAAKPTTGKTTDEKFSELIDSSKDWVDLTEPEEVVFFKKRLTLLRELFEARDLKPSQRNYCELQFIDTVELLLRGSQNTDAEIEGVDELVHYVEQTFGKSTNPKVFSAANLLVIRQLKAKYVANPSDQNFEAFRDAFHDKQSVISKTSRGKLLLNNVMNEAVVAAGDDPRLRKMAIEHLARVVVNPDTVVTDLAISLFFPRSDLRNLPARIFDEGPKADDDLQSLLKRLKRHPDMPVKIYSVVASSIARYQDNGETIKAQQALEEFQKIAQLITVKQIRTKVLKFIDKLRDGPPSN